MTNFQIFQRLAEKDDKQQGFTLVELLMTVAIAAIMLSLATPAFYPLVQSYRISSAINLLERGLRHARQEAVLKNKTVRICPSEDGLSCSEIQDWSSGFLSYIDLNQDAVKQPDEETLRLHPSSYGVAIRFNRQRQVSFNGLGRSGINGTFSICDPANKVKTQQITLIHSGRLRKAIGPAGCV